MTADMPCDCTHPKDGHAGLAYACWTCDCKRYTPDIQAASNAASLARDLAELEATDPDVAEAAARLDETTAAILAKAKTMPTDSASARLRRVEQERDELATAVAGWVARFHAAYEALAIDEFDGDSCSDLEDTIRYAVDAYRSVCEAEANAADRLDLLRAELASACAELQQLRAQLAGRGAP